jgi:hypothetical protein
VCASEGQKEECNHNDYFLPSNIHEDKFQPTLVVAGDDEIYIGTIVVRRADAFRSVNKSTSVLFGVVTHSCLPDHYRG